MTRYRVGDAVKGPRNEVKIMDVDEATQTIGVYPPFEFDTATPYQWGRIELWSKLTFDLLDALQKHGDTTVRPAGAVEEG